MVDKTEKIQVLLKRSFHGSAKVTRHILHREHRQLEVFARLAAAKLRTSPLQTAALATCGIFLLFGLAGYILAGQRKPSPQAARALFYLLVNSGFIAMAFIGRLAALARRGLDKPPASSVKPVDALGSLDLPGA